MTGYYGSTYYGQYWPQGVTILNLALGKVEGAQDAYGVTLTGTGSATLDLNKVASTFVVRGIDLTNALLLELGKVVRTPVVYGVEITYGGILYLGKVIGAATVRGITLAGTGSASLGIGKIATTARAWGVCLFRALGGSVAETEDTLTMAVDVEDTIALTSVAEATILETSVAEGTSLTVTAESTEDTLTLTPADDGTC